MTVWVRDLCGIVPPLCGTGFPITVTTTKAKHAAAAGPSLRGRGSSILLPPVRCYHHHPPAAERSSSFHAPHSSAAGPLGCASGRQAALSILHGRSPLSRVAAIPGTESSSAIDSRNFLVEFE